MAPKLFSTGAEFRAALTGAINADLTPHVQAEMDRSYRTEVLNFLYIFQTIEMVMLVLILDFQSLKDNDS
jgi:hypothetical protein